MKKIPFHLIERDPDRSIIHWIYMFDRGGRRHVLGITRVEMDAQGVRLMIRHHLVRKDLHLGPLDTTTLAPESLTKAAVDLAFFDHLVSDPLQMGEAVAAFLEQHFLCIAAHANYSAHEQFQLLSDFRGNLAHARKARRQAALDRKIRLEKVRAAGIVPKVDLKDGRLVRFCPKWHKDLSTVTLSTLFRVSRKPRSRKYSLVAVDGPLNGRRYAPPGFQQVYLDHRREEG